MKIVSAWSKAKTSQRDTIRQTVNHLPASTYKRQKKCVSLLLPRQSQFSRRRNNKVCSHRRQPHTPLHHARKRIQKKWISQRLSAKGCSPLSVDKPSKGRLPSLLPLSCRAVEPLCLLPPDRRAPPTSSPPAAPNSRVTSPASARF